MAKGTVTRSRTRTSLLSTAATVALQPEPPPHVVWLGSAETYIWTSVVKLVATSASTRKASLVTYGFGRSTQAAAPPVGRMATLISVVLSLGGSA